MSRISILRTKKDVLNNKLANECLRIVKSETPNREKRKKRQVN